MRSYEWKDVEHLLPSPNNTTVLRYIKCICELFLFHFYLDSLWFHSVTLVFTGPVFLITLFSYALHLQQAVFPPVKLKSFICV